MVHGLESSNRFKERRAYAASNPAACWWFRSPFPRSSRDSTWRVEDMALDDWGYDDMIAHCLKFDQILPYSSVIRLQEYILNHLNASCTILWSESSWQFLWSALKLRPNHPIPIVPSCSTSLTCPHLPQLTCCAWPGMAAGKLFRVPQRWQTSSISLAMMSLSAK